MLGIVFTEFLEMVEAKFDLETVDSILDEASVSNDGAYTAVGTYNHEEIVDLVKVLSQRTGIPVDHLIQTFGQYLAGRFAKLYPEFFKGLSDPFEFLDSVGSYIHREVKKLYPNAQLPSITTEALDASTLAVDYRSHRSFGKLAEGLIMGAMAHFNCEATIEIQQPVPGDTSNVRFIVRKANP